MTNRQASKLRVGERVRPKGEDGAVCAVERVERISRTNGADMLVHAGGRTFWAWGIERCDPPQGWPTEGGGPMTSKYDRLADYLAARGGTEITLTFAEVEEVVGPLPKEARRTSPWWGVQGKAYSAFPHATHWRRRGFVAERPDFKAGTVTFRRVSP